MSDKIGALVCRRCRKQGCTMKELKDFGGMCNKCLTKEVNEKLAGLF